MEIIVCVKRVPDLSEADVSIDSSGRAIREDDLVFGLNDWDRFAVEEALRIKEDQGGRVTVLTVGDEDSEDVLRRALAMGADEALRLWDPSFVGVDGHTTARILQAAIMQRPFDVVLLGSVSSDSGSGVVGGMLAALLDVPQVALATAIGISGRTVSVRHEVEGGLEREVEVDLPALVSVQTGINEPRYVSIRGIRRVADVHIPTANASSLGLDDPGFVESTAWVRLEELFVPPAGRSAEILTGRTDEVVDQLVERLKTRAGV